METDTAKHIERLLSLLKAPVAGTTDSTTQFWEKYSEEAEEYDKDFLEKNRNNMESVLIFSGLFSAVAAGFLVSMQATLSPNPTDTTNALLMMLVHSSNDTAFPDQTYVIPAWEGPRSSDVWSQAIGYTGLSASLLAALGAVLGKQWLTDFTRLRRGPLQERGRRRQQKMDGLKKWRFEVVMGVLPALIQLALLLFGIALSINLWHLNRTVGSVVVAATAVGGSLYLCFTIASLFSPSCPFHTPVSSTIQEAIAIVMKSLEETCQYWAWRSSDTVQKPLRISPVSKLLAYLPAFITLPLLALVSAVIAMISIGPIILIIGIWWLQARRPDHRIGEDLNSLLYWFQCQFAASRRKFHRTACLVRDFARHVRDFIYRVYLDPQPDPQVSDSSSIAWLLETSNHPDFLMTAAMLVPDAKWPEDLDLSLPTQHLCNIFIRSISEKGYMHDRALTLGKAFVIMLCQESQDVSPHVWHETLRELQRIKGNLIDQDHDQDCDLPFILTVVTKLLHLKSNLDPRLVELSTEHPVSQSLLTWFLQPLQILLHPGDPRRPHFFPEAHRVFLKLDWTEGSKLSVLQQVQYCRVFEVYLSDIGGLPTNDTLDNVRSTEQDPIHEQADILSRALVKLQQASDPLPTNAHQNFLVPLTVISMLSGVPHLKPAFEGKDVESWALKAFSGAVHGATGTNDRASWLFASSLFQLASQASCTDAPDSTDSQDQRDDTKPDEPKYTPSVSPPTVDFDSLLSYLLNKVGRPVSVEQATYAFKIMLVNTDQLAVFVHRPDFINYVVNTTGPGQAYSVRDVGLKVHFAACESLLRTYGQPGDLLSLASHSNLGRFIHRALLYQDPPSTLIYLLSLNDDALSEALLRVLSTSLGDPFTVLLTKLRTEPNRIPERDLRDFEITLILAKSNRRKLSDHLDRSIETIQKSRSHEMALALMVIVGWLLRPGGPASSSQSLKQQLLRPATERLLVPAWRDPDALEEGPQMLRLLLICTSEWLTTCQSSLPLRAFSDLETALHELTGNTRMLSADIKRSLQKTLREMKELRAAEERSLHYRGLR